MQIHNTASEYGSGHRHAMPVLAITLLGAAFLINSFIARLLFADNPLVADLSAALGALILFLPILAASVRDLREGEMHMNELVALAVLAAMTQGHFQTAAVVSLIMLVSLVIETRTAEGAHASIESLVKLTPTVARKLGDDGGETMVPAEQLAVGDRICVRAGENIPADGEIASGQSTLNEATITGESLPCDKGPGESVFAGTQNLTGMIEVIVTKVGANTTIGRVREMILSAEKARLPIMRIIDRHVRFYTPTALMIAFLVWFFTDDMDRVVALLVVACPCAFILATPTAMVAALSAAARLGILVKNVADLESAAGISAVVLDKTGTLTTGRLGVARLKPRDGVEPARLLTAAAGAERHSNHPAAIALAKLASEAGVRISASSDYHEEAGQGVRATVNGKSVLCGRASWLRANGISDPLLNVADATETEGYSVIFVSEGGEYLGWLGLQDQVRAGAKTALEQLAGLSVKRIVMTTGDRASVARQVAAEIGCREFRAECLPQEKVDLVNSIKKAGYHVAFVGDGVNDAPALAASDTGIAMGAAGSDVAIHSATIALMNSDLLRLPFLMRLSRRARSVIYQNLSVGALFIIGGLIFSGMGMLNPILAALLHNAGSLIVVFNSARLIKLGEELQTPQPAKPPAAVTRPETVSVSQR